MGLSFECIYLNLFCFDLVGIKQPSSGQSTPFAFPIALSGNKENQQWTVRILNLQMGECRKDNPWRILIIAICGFSLLREGVKGLTSYWLWQEQYVVVQYIWTYGMQLWFYPCHNMADQSLGQYIESLLSSPVIWHTVPGTRTPWQYLSTGVD